MASTVVLLGTGTSVGKTYVGERLLRAVAATGGTALGYKPIESGVSGAEDTDIARLARASTFHVKPPLLELTFRAPVAPYLAARMEGRAIDLTAVRREVERACASAADVVIFELPGGAFSPMEETICCAEFAREMGAARAVLVAPDRLGVLHDVGATTRACAALGLPLHGIVLSAPETSDASTGNNGEEFRIVTAVPLLARFPRGQAGGAVATDDPAMDLARRLFPRR